MIEDRIKKEISAADIERLWVFVLDAANRMATPEISFSERERDNFAAARDIVKSLRY